MMNGWLTPSLKAKNQFFVRKIGKGDFLSFQKTFWEDYSP